MEVISYWVIWLVALFLVVDQAQGKEVEVIGQAVIGQQGQNQIRQKALEDAIRQASLMSKASVRSSQILQGLNLVADDVEVRANGSVENIQVLKEWDDDGIFYIKIRANALSVPSCPSKDHLGLRKTIAIAGFPVQNREQLLNGHLDDIEHKMAEQFVMMLNREGNVQSINAGHLQLYSQVNSAPASWTSRHTLTTAVNVAKHVGAQYVVSGVIRDMDMVNPEAREARFYDKPLSWVGMKRKKRLRQFAIDIFVHDGVSGVMLLQKVYTTAGEWIQPRNARIGFATAEFWKSEYGKQIRILLKDISLDIDGTLKCQPFMSRIVRAQDKKVYINAGTNSGIRPGHKLKLVKARYFYDVESQERMQLDPTGEYMTIKKVQPSFAIAEVSKTLNRLHIQVDDYAVTW